MKIWEAIIYGIFGGAAELLPISFGGHSTVLREVFNLSSLQQGGGYYVRAAICLGVLAAILLSFSSESRAFGRELLFITGLKHRRRGQRTDSVLRRSILLGFFALVPMLCTLLFTAAAEGITKLWLIALLFALNGLVIFLCCRRRVGKKTEKTVLLSDTLLIGFARMLSVFPGLSSVGSSMAVARARGLSVRYALRLTYLLTLCYEAAAFLFYLIRAFCFGSFSVGTLLPMLLAMLFSGIVGYFAIQYFRYLLNRDKLHVFSYYCWDAAVIVLILSLINS